MVCEITFDLLIQAEHIIFHSICCGNIQKISKTKCNPVVVTLFN